MSARRVILGVVVLTLLRAASVRAEDADPLAFNEAIVGANKQLENAGYEYGKSLVPLFRLEPVNSAELKGKHDQIRKVYADVVAEMKKVAVPDSDEARAFKKSHDRFLDGQKELVDSDLVSIQKIVDDNSLDAKSKQLKVQGVLESMSGRERKAQEKLVEAQAAFAKRYNITILDKDE